MGICFPTLTNLLVGSTYVLDFDDKDEKEDDEEEMFHIAADLCWILMIRKKMRMMKKKCFI